MGAQQPYMYGSGVQDPRFPVKEFDPKAVTRASWEPKPKKPKQEGPYISFNRHPDLHEVPTGRTSQFRPIGRRTKRWIVWIRKVQLGFRVLELIAGCGLVTLMILISGVNEVTAWVMRIAPGVAALTCVYAIWHLSRSAGSRPPASSAAYQIFAGVTDLTVLPFYAFGAVSLVKSSGEWSTILPNKDLMDYFVPAEFYTLIAAGSMHAVSMCMSIWLAVMFRRIVKMPPDLNPLESHLTRRVHKRNKSSVASDYSLMSESVKRLSTPLEDHRRSGAAYETLSRPPSIPFMHTRQGSKDSFTSFASSNRDSRQDLPSRQYQIVPGNSARNSVASLADAKRMSAPPRSSHRGNYTEIPLHETGATGSRPGSSRPNSAVSPASSQPINASPTRIAKFTEAWYASDSLISRTQQRQNAMDAAAKNPRAYEALNQRYDGDSDSEQENIIRPNPMEVSDLEDEDDGGSPINATGRMHPNPLRSHPPPPTPPKGQPLAQSKAPLRVRNSALAEVSLNSRSVSGSKDITDMTQAPLPRPKSMASGWGRDRDSSIQPEEFFSSKRYGDLKSGTPPIMVGNGRQVSSGNDYDLGVKPNKGYRRNVSGKVAEEGMAGPQGGYSRFSRLNL